MGLNIYGSLIILHLIAACVWVGVQAVLAFSILPQAVQERDGAGLYRISSLYSTVGLPALALEVMTGVLLAYLHLPDFGSWVDFGNPMGRLIGTKVILLGVLLVLGIDLRVRLFPKVSSKGLKILRWPVWLILLFSVLQVFVGASFRIGWLY